MIDVSGVYIGNYDYKFVEIDLLDEDDDVAHLDLEKPKIIQYVGGDKDSLEKLKGKYLPEGQGVTYQLFNPGEDDAQEDQGSNEDGDEKEEITNYIFIPDVVTDGRIHFFEIPRLGSYLAVPIFVRGYLNEMAFNDGLNKISDWKKKEQELQEFKKEKEEEFEEQIMAAKDAEEDYQDIVDQWENYEWEANPEPEILAEEKEYVFCCDTLGLDKAISPEDLDFIKSMCKTFAESWENQELKYLKSDVEKYLTFEEEFNIPDLIDDYENEEKDREDAIIGQISSFTEDEQSFKIKKEQ